MGQLYAANVTYESVPAVHGRTPCEDPWTSTDVLAEAWLDPTDVGCST